MGRVERAFHKVAEKERPEDFGKLETRGSGRRV